MSATLCFGAAAVAPAASSAATSRTTLSGTAVAAALQSHAVGAVDASSQVSFELVLKLRDEAGAQALLQAVSTPGSAEYRHYITAAQWEARFSPTAAQVAAAEQWLTSEGFTLGGVSKDRITISATGTAAQVESAFGTSLENYKIAGVTRRMATTDLSIPTSIAGVVAGTLGVNEEIATPDNTNGSDAASATTTAASSSNTSLDPPAPGAFIPRGPCSTYYGQATSTENFGNGYPTRQEANAGVALMNIASSNINQWTLLVAMLPVVFSLSRGEPSGFALDPAQRTELLLTVGQSFVSMLFLLNMYFSWLEAIAMFVLFAVQFVLPAFFGDEVRRYITWAFLIWTGGGLVLFAIRRPKVNAVSSFLSTWREHFGRRP